MLWAAKGGGRVLEFWGSSPWITLWSVVINWKSYFLYVFGSSTNLLIVFCFGFQIRFFVRLWRWVGQAPFHQSGGSLHNVVLVSRRCRFRFLPSSNRLEEIQKEEKEEESSLRSWLEEGTWRVWTHSLNIKTRTSAGIKESVTANKALFGQRPRRGRWPMLSHIWGIFSSFSYVPPSNPSLKAQIPVSRPKSQSWGPNPSLKAQILASRPKS